MKNIFLGVTFFIIASSYSQTKQETENYIINKLKLYSKKSNYYKIEFNLDGSSLKVTHNPIDDRFEKKTYVIPIWAIESISITRNNNSSKLYFTLNKYCKSCKKYISGYKQKYKREYYTAYEYGWAYGKQTKKQVEKSRRVKDGYSRYENQDVIASFYIDFTSADPEEDFLGRFIRGMNYLKKLYPQKPKSNDLFGN
tara:strand:+ start:402 stop:992 length:591 start_codon:yes stop_codon:yes gene_type:complete